MRLKIFDGYNVNSIMMKSCDKYAGQGMANGECRLEIADWRIRI